MVKISENFIAQLKAVCDITSVISSYVELKSMGRNKKCLCPFHLEKTPSLVVYEETQSFYCFGCGAGGDVIIFIEKIENLNYVDAVKLLASRVGMTVPEDEQDDELSKKRERILKMNKIAAKFFFNNLRLDKGKAGLEYFYKRQILKKTIIKFGLGYAADSWNDLQNHLESKGFSCEEMFEADLVSRSTKNGNINYYDKFRNRVIFPIIDLRGNVIGFGGRVLDDSKPKYLNSSDTVVFKKSLGLYALYFAKNNRLETLILCEGYMDVIAMHQGGFTNAVATLGTALTAEQTRLMSRHAKDLVIAYDSDKAGRIAMERASKMFMDIGIKPRVLKINGAKDPDEYIKKYGAGRLKVAIDEAQSVTKTKIENMSDKYDLDDPEQKRNYINEYCAFICNMVDPLDREVYIGELCRELGLPREVISNQVNFVLNKKRKSYRKNVDREFARVSYRDKINPDSAKYPKAAKAEQGIIKFLFNNPDYADYIYNKIKPDEFITKWHKRVYEIMLDRLKLNDNFDVSAFHSVFDEDEMGRFSKIINEDSNFSNTVEVLDDYISVVKDEHEKNTENISDMTLEQIENRRKDKAKKKRW